MGDFKKYGHSLYGFWKKYKEDNRRESMKILTGDDVEGDRYGESDDSLEDEFKRRYDQKKEDSGRKVPGVKEICEESLDNYKLLGEGGDLKDEELEDTILGPDELERDYEDWEDYNKP